MIDQFQSMDNRLLSLDDHFQLMEEDVAQIKINVRNILCYVLPENQRDQVPWHLF